jgi:DNA modification methylase
MTLASSSEQAARPISSTDRPPWTASPEEVAQFVRDHGRPYDPSSDDYVDPGPFSHAVKEGKNSPIYNAHAYHTKVPPEGIVPYVEHFTRKGDLVLDPFCGSGMTGVACLVTGRNAILNDLSPAATHIAYNYCNPVDVPALRREFERIIEAVRDEFDWLYGTTCDKGHPATIVYTVWSDVFRCRSCRGDIVLWDAALDQATGIVQERFNCPSCGRGPFKKTDLELIRSEPVESALECNEKCRTKSRKRTRYRHAPTTEERSHLAEIDQRAIPYWYPTAEFSPQREMYIRSALQRRGIHQADNFWTKRNLWALSCIWHQASKTIDRRLHSAVEFAFTSIVLNSARTTRYRFGKAGNGAVTGTLYLPSFSTENNPLWLLDHKLKDIFDAYWGLFESLATRTYSAAMAVCGPAQSIRMQSDSVDYIFTDPPFGSNIFYADCSFLWEIWLGYFTDERNEAVWNKSRKPTKGGKTLDDYESLMTDAFREMYRVLKPGRWASVVFHNSDDRVWQAIQRGALTAGFEIVGAQQLDKVQLSFKGIKGQKGQENVTNKDVVLNLQKPVRTGRPLELAPDAEEIVADAIVEHLHSGPPADERGLQALQGLAIRALINRGFQVEVSWRSVETALRHLGCKQVDGAWYLPGEDVPGSALDIRDEASAIGWVRQILTEEGPRTRGELTPRFQQASLGASLRKALAELLDENFVLNERTNRWRLPTPEERERLNDTHALAQRREIGRILEGRPTRAYSDAELADLVIAAYRMGMYAAVARVGSLVRADALPTDTRSTIEQLQAIASMKMEASEEMEPSQGRLL